MRYLSWFSRMLPQDLRSVDNIGWIKILGGTLYGITYEINTTSYIECSISKELIQKISSNFQNPLLDEPAAVELTGLTPYQLNCATKYGALNKVRGRIATIYQLERFDLAERWYEEKLLMLFMTFLAKQNTTLLEKEYLERYNEPNFRRLPQNASIAKYSKIVA